MYFAHRLLIQTIFHREDLEKMMTGDEKSGPPQIQDFRDHNTDVTIRMIVQMEQEKLQKAEAGKGLHSFFKLQTTMSTTSMVLFDHMGCLKKYETVEEILMEFFTLRLEYYGKRKAYMEGLLGAEAARLTNQARFILEKCSGDLKIENKKKKVMIEDLVRRKYDSDPVKAWKASLAVDDDDEEEAGDSQESIQSEGGDESKSTGKDKGPDYDYLLGMPMWNLTQEKIDEICKKRDDKQQELANLKAQTKEDLWQIDLKAFLEKLDEVEEKERMELEEGRGGDDGDQGGSGASKAAKKGKSGKGKSGKGMVKADTLPSKTAVRFEPKITDELKAKVEQAAAAKQRKATKKSEKADGNSQDEDNLATEGKKGIKKEGKEGKLKQTKINFKAEKKEANPFSDEESDDISGKYFLNEF